MSKSKYHEEAMIEASQPDGTKVIVPRRKAYRTAQVKEGLTGGKVKVFGSKVYKLNSDGSLDNMKPKLTKQQKKAAKKLRQQNKLEVV